MLPYEDWGCLMDDLRPFVDDKNSYNRAYANYLLGCYSMNFDHFRGTADYLNKAKEAANHFEVNNQYTKKLQIKISLATGAYYFYLGNLNQALQANEHASEINRSLKDFILDASISNNQGSIYKNLGQNQKAIAIFKRNCQPDFYGSELYPLALSNIAEAYLNMDILDSAYCYLCKAMQADIGPHRNYSPANAYYLLGQIYLQKKQIDSANLYFMKSFDLANEMKEENVKMQVLVSLIELYSSTSQYEQALKKTSELLELGEHNNNLLAKTVALREKSWILDRMSRKAEAFEVLKKYITLNDSLNIRENTEKAKQSLLMEEFHLEQQKLEYEYEKGKLRLENRIGRQKWMLASVLFLLLGVSGIFLIYGKKKKEEKEAQKLVEKALLENLEIKEKELTDSLLFRMNKDELIKKIISELQALGLGSAEKSRKKISSLISSLRRSINPNLLTEFENSFTQINNNFYERLLADFPSLSQSEKRLCAFIKLGLNTKEIAVITNLSPNSIRVAKVRLRKKLNLTNNNQTLYDFISRY
ncbi:MAG: LuxR C-terminal-related transcriptional regulator [Bacteroidales bacterium]|nr:LuxR C-terminal-related transcriptional regulator [Bacteroidales bacterium]